jgi:RNA-directed DNA polymerase
VTLSENCQASHPCSYAYSKDCSHVKCASIHAGCEWLIKIDIRQFFESINEIQVFRIFRACGYEPLVAFELARLTTRLSRRKNPLERMRWMAESHYWLKYMIATYRSDSGHLPQGAPTSPMLANLVMRRFDAIAANIATDFGTVYTRYSDDLAFSSGDHSFGRKAANELIRRIYGLLQSFGMQPKVAKTNIAPPGARRVVLGLTVNDCRPRLTRTMKRRIECHVHYIEKLGYIVHAREREFASALGCFNYIQGLVSYAYQVDKEFGDTMRQRLSTVAPPF